MTLLTMEEAAQFLRLSKRTLYQRKDIPRVREGHRILFLREDLETWILAHREVTGISITAPETGAALVDGSRRTVYHRSPALRSKVVR
jgi:excisionase family DNA binding protein